MRFERVEIGSLLMLFTTEGLGAFPELTGRRQGERMGTVGLAVTFEMLQRCIKDSEWEK